MDISLITLAVAVVFQAQGAKALQPAPPQVLGSIDVGKLKGQPTELAWSPDGTQFFLQTTERDEQAMVKNPRNFLIDVADPKPKPVSAVPDWAQEYWAWKSGQSAPGLKTFNIDIKREERTGTATSAPMGGSLARGGATGDPNAGTTVEDVASRAQQMQRQQVITLTSKNEIVGEFLNTQFLPGYTFGWGPQGSAMIAYRNQAGRLGIMDERGGKWELGASRDVLLPAWSTDGSRIAFLQKSAKNKYDLVVLNLK